ncbi:MAG: 16S rRNA (guanine(966)-N(2))-methyltransferase RsmD [Bacteroidota bacterium]|nr:16S rRNA (guanine(966)-N(2))-methyltransferase RsmD [Bacteroidota bacterium]
MRIISGKHKGRRIQPPVKLPVRPTTDVAKEGLFNILMSRIDFEELQVIDLFAGTGNISFEFASRGAPRITSVDQNHQCISFISEFAKKLDMSSIRAIRADVIRFLERSDEAADLIFADPPYDFQHHGRIIQLVFERQLLKENGMLILEHGKDKDFSKIEGFREQRKYGHVMFSFFS